MFALTVTPDQRLKKNRITCMSKDPTIAGILMVGSCEVVSSTRPSDRNVRTACTNGRDEWYSEEFMAKLTDAELRFVVMHEGYCLLYTSPSPRDRTRSRMPSSA